MIWPLKKWLEWIISSERRAGQADVSDGFALGSRLNGVLALFCELTSMPAQAWSKAWCISTMASLLFKAAEGAKKGHDGILNVIKPQARVPYF